MATRLKRRSSLQHHPRLGGGAHAHAHAHAHDGAGSSNESFDDPPDDIAPAEEERERRARRGLQKRQSMGHVGHSPTVAVSNLDGTPTGGRTVGQQQSVYSDAQLAEIYDSCIRLSAENKINAKNAFHLKMIDYMADMVRKKKSDMDNFQAASCALDASTKIYAYRVDAVHTDTLKLASGVGSNKPEKEDVGGDARRGEGEEDGEEGEAKKKRKKRKRATMVEKNLNNINCSNFELEFDVDPLFKKVSAQFDSGGGAGGQFLSTLRMRDDGCELLMDSNALSSSSGAAPVARRSVGEPLQFDAQHLPRIKEDHLICPTFAAFSFRDWSLEKEESLQQSQEAETAARKAAQGGQGVNGLAESDVHVFDPEAVPVENDDVDGGMFGGADFNDVDGEEGEGTSGYGPGGKNHVTMALMDVKTLRDHLSSVPTEYSYFDTGRLGAWAGPKHWKFKPFHRAPAAADEDKKKRQRKEKEKVNFEEMDDANKLLSDFVERSLTVPKRAIKLQNKTMMNWGDEKNVLPEDMHYSGKDFVKLEGLIKSNVAPRRIPGEESQSIDDTVEDYNFDNPNDTQNFCPDLGSGAEGNYAPESETGNTGMADFTAAGDSQSACDLAGASGAPPFAAEEGGGLGLIAAPNRVEKIQIGYARLAKKIDMRKLKSVEWDILNESIQGIDKENSKDFNKTDAGSKEQRRDSTSLLAEKGTTFKEMYSLLLGPSQLPTKMKENLSVPLAFVALLHLCNEHILELRNEDGLDNLVIRKVV